MPYSRAVACFDTNYYVHAAFLQLCEDAFPIKADREHNVTEYSRENADLGKAKQKARGSILAQRMRQ